MAGRTHRASDVDNGHGCSVFRAYVGDPYGCGRGEALAASQTSWAFTPVWPGHPAGRGDLRRLGESSDDGGRRPGASRRSGPGREAPPIWAPGRPCRGTGESGPCDSRRRPGGWQPGSRAWTCRFPSTSIGCPSTPPGWIRSRSCSANCSGRRSRPTTSRAPITSANASWASAPSATDGLNRSSGPPPVSSLLAKVRRHRKLTATG